MASGVTNRGINNLFDVGFRGVAPNATFYLALVTSATVPTCTLDTLNELAEISDGNGYQSGGYTLYNNSSDFDVLTEEGAGANNVVIQIKDVAWTANGGPISSARYAVLLEYHATVTSRVVVAWFDLASDRTVSDGQTLTIQNCEIRATHP